MSPGPKPGAHSRSTSPRPSRSITARSVTIRSTHSAPVTSYWHSLTIFGWPDRSQCHMAMMSLPGLTSRSIAPPIAPPPICGVVQFANEPRLSTWNAPRITAVSRPERAISNASVESKTDAPGRSDTGSAPAL